MELKRDLKDWYDSWLKYTDNSEAPTIYNKWVAVSMIASVLERKVYLKWDKKIYPNFYLVLVGPPGCRKGTAMAPGREILDEMNITIAADASSKEKLASRLQEASDTFEAMDGNVHNYAAMTIFSEEFTVFLGYGNIELMQWMSDWYDCKNHWKYETKHQGVSEVDGVWVNLLGATTPGLLQDSVQSESFGGGLNSRIIYVFAEKKAKLVIFPFLTPHQDELKEQLIRDLQIIRLTAGVFTPDTSYMNRYEKWYPTQHKIQLAQNEQMAGYIERRPTHLHKTAMVMNAARNGGLVLTADDFDKALSLLEETERFMGTTFAGVGKSPMASTMNKVLQYIKMMDGILYSELLQHFYNDADDRTLGIIVSTLERGKVIRLERKEGQGLRDYSLYYIADK